MVCGSTAAAAKFRARDFVVLLLRLLVLDAAGKRDGPDVRIGIGAVPLDVRHAAEDVVHVERFQLVTRPVTSSACMSFTVIGWSPSLVMTRNTGRIPSSLKCVMKMSSFGELLYTSTAAVTFSLGCASLQA